jgi:23S rRNA (cytidine1920-2'-O)/16S rRNA (cytidine1409-2'-O)-methyltransferase
MTNDRPSGAQAPLSFVMRSRRREVIRHCKAMRADQLLVKNGLAPTRSAAQRLIERGAVRWRGGGDWSVPRKAGEDLPEGCQLEVTDDAELRWASRAGLKLEGALDHTGVNVQDRVCLDVGQSTGGFTDVLLARGAEHVVGIDVGHGQLLPRLASDARVTSLEGVNARSIDASTLPYPRYALVVADLSFISLALVLPALAPLIAQEALLLVKPQFELQPADIGKGGLVTDAASYARVETKLRSLCAELHLPVRAYFASPIDGGDGNREFFLWIQR